MAPLPPPLAASSRASGPGGRGRAVEREEECRQRVVREGLALLGSLTHCAGHAAHVPQSGLVGLSASLPPGGTVRGPQGSVQSWGSEGRWVVLFSFKRRTLSNKTAQPRPTGSLFDCFWSLRSARGIYGDLLLARGEPTLIMRGGGQVTAHGVSRSLEASVCAGSGRPPRESRRDGRGGRRGCGSLQGGGRWGVTLAVSIQPGGSGSSKNAENQLNRARGKGQRKRKRLCFQVHGRAVRRCHFIRVWRTSGSIPAMDTFFFLVFVASKRRGRAGGRGAEFSFCY